MTVLRTNRRRILSGLCGLGLAPIPSYAQTPPPVKFQCEINSGNAQGTERTKTTVKGSASDAITRQSSAFTMRARKTEAFSPFTGAFGPGVVAEVTLYDYSGLKTDGSSYPEDFMIRFSRFAFSKDWPDPPSFPAEIVFDFADGRPMTYYGDINKSSVGTASAYCLFKLSNSPKGLPTANRIFNAWDKAGKATVLVRSRSDQRVWLKAKLPGLNWKGIRSVFNENYKEAYAKLDAGNCPVTEGCFLTTAASLAAGLPDDCAELRALRAFRDGPMQTLAGGQNLIAEYYAIAPIIVERINALPDARAIWLSLYAKHIIPAAMLANMGLNSAAMKRYVAMTRSLKRRTGLI